MWMPPLETSWQGKVEFYELIFGTWTVYALLVLAWERVLREPLAEWRYAMITFLGAGAFWVNHYWLKAPSPVWLILINLYTVFFLTSWWAIAVRALQPVPAGSLCASLPGRNAGPPRRTRRHRPAGRRAELRQHRGGV